MKPSEKPILFNTEMEKAIQFLEDEIGECHDNPNIDNEIIAELMVRFAENVRRRERFAARAMQGILSNESLRKAMFYDIINRLRDTDEGVNEVSIQLEFAKEYYLIADSMMEVGK